MANVLRYGLPMDGRGVYSLDELREHFTVDIVKHFRSGKLIKWLKDRDLSRQLDAVRSLKTENDTVMIDDATALKKLCRIFDIEADDDDIAISIGQITSTPGLVRLDQPYPHLHQFILWVHNSIIKLTFQAPLISDSDNGHSADIYGYPNITFTYRFLYINFILYRHIIWEIANNCTDEEFGSYIRSQLSNHIDHFLSHYSISKDRYLEWFAPIPDYLKVSRSKSEIERLVKEFNLLSEYLHPI